MGMKRWTVINFTEEGEPRAWISDVLDNRRSDAQIVRRRHDGALEIILDLPKLLVRRNRSSGTIQVFIHDDLWKP